MLSIRQDDLEGEDVRALLALHLAGMHASSPPGHVFALDLTGLKNPSVTVWTVWDDDALAGIGALKDLHDGTAELKSMRTHPDHLRKGVAAHLLEHIIATAKARGHRRLSLETGTGEPFEAAVALYLKRGFRHGEEFSDYVHTEFNQLMHMDL